MTEGGQEEREVILEGVVEAADCFMARWHRYETLRSRLRHATKDTKNGGKRRRGGGRGSRTDRATDECRNEMIDRVARCRFD